MRRLSPAEAVKTLEEDPSSFWITPRELMRSFGLTQDELMAELRSGRLQAHGEPRRGGGYKNVLINGQNLLEWMADTGRRPISRN
jgi:hypothetical protein